MRIDSFQQHQTLICGRGARWGLNVIVYNRNDSTLLIPNKRYSNPVRDRESVQENVPSCFSLPLNAYFLIFRTRKQKQKQLKAVKKCCVMSYESRNETVRHVVAFWGNPLLVVRCKSHKTIDLHPSNQNNNNTITTTETK